MDLDSLFLVWKYGARLLLMVCLLWAMWRGGFTERAGAAILGLGWFLSYLLRSPGAQGASLYVVAIDIVVFLMYLALALWSRRLWVFFAAAGMLIAIACHYAARTMPFGVYSYVTIAGFWGGSAQLIFLAAGIIGHQRKLKRERQQALL